VLARHRCCTFAVGDRLRITSAATRLTVGATRTPAWVLGFAEQHDIRMLDS